MSPDILWSFIGFGTLDNVKHISLIFLFEEIHFNISSFAGLSKQLYNIPQKTFQFKPCILRSTPSIFSQQKSEISIKNYTLDFILAIHFIINVTYVQTQF
jgi:hypothetical protein